MPNFRGRTILITGGLGLIGSNLARRLVSLGAQVTILDNMIPHHGGTLNNITDIINHVRLNISDIRDSHSLAHFIDGSHIIFNLAGQTSHMASMTDPLTDLSINCLAPLTLLELCRTRAPLAKIIYTSTRQVYGRSQYLPVDELHPINPPDINAIHKYAAESYHLLYNHVHKIRSTVLRLTNVYGPGMRVKDAKQNFLGAWIGQAVQGRSFDVLGGQQLRDLSFVDDTVDALLYATLPETDGKVFNIAGDSVLRLIDLATALSVISGTKYKIKEYPPERKLIDIGDYYGIDNSFRAITGWEPKVSIRDGLQATFDFYLSNLTKYL
jgi:UDP-glucose 4-epimerase